MVLLNVVPLNVVAVLVGGCLAIVGSLIVLNLRSIKQCLRSYGQRIDKQDNQIEKTQTDVKIVQTSFSSCKVDCERSFVDKERFLRETGFARRTLENVTATINRLEGKLTVVEKLPQIVGDISRSIVKEMSNGANNGKRT